METGCHFGMCFAVYSIMSTTIRVAGRGPTTHSFWAMYSLRTSFWMVPPSLSCETPCFSPTMA